MALRASRSATQRPPIFRPGIEPFCSMKWVCRFVRLIAFPMLAKPQINLGGAMALSLVNFSLSLIRSLANCRRILLL
jgi:hypothetical protein